MKLVIFRDNYADEFETEGFRVFDDEEYKDWLKEQQGNEVDEDGDDSDHIRYPREFYFGTNESIEYKTFKQFINHVEVVEISNTQAKFLDKINMLSFGIFPD